ncbi:Dos2-interacting transcription regulator of RNA-Pol-II-domain-containing protein, partial [Paraphysoderma sedebokerense]
LLSLVESLGDYLTNEDAFVRAKGTCFLLTSSPSVLNEFYCERLHDQICVPELFRGLLPLLESKSLTGDNILKIPKTIFAEVNVQTFQQTVRHHAFKIFEFLVENHLQLIKGSMEAEFLMGYIQAMDGEKDPRNLMLAFKIVTMLLKSCNVNRFAEDFFEITFCYFPITFKPPPDDPYGITADDLKNGLRECLSASPLFAQYALPMLLEKLSSTSINAKRDSLKVLSSAAAIYGAESMLPHLKQLWELIKDEIYQSADETHENTALETLQTLVAVASSSATTVSTSGSDPVESFIQNIVKECLEHLKEPELKLAKPSGRTLSHVAMASDPACHFVLNRAIPVLIEQIKKEELATRRKTLLEVLLEFVKACRELYGSRGESKLLDEDFSAPLGLYKDTFIQLFSSALTASNEYLGLRKIGAGGLFEMIMLRDFLSEDEVGVIIQYFNQVIVSDNDSDLRMEATLSLGEIAKVCSDTVLKVVIPFFFNKLPDDPEIQSQSTSTDSILVGLSYVAVNSDITQSILPQLISEISKCTLSTPTPSLHNHVLSLLNTLLQIVQKSFIDYKFCLESLIPDLVEKCVVASLPSQNKLMADEAVIGAIGRIVGVVMKSVNEEMQAKFVRFAFEVFVNGTNLSDTCYLDRQPDTTPAQQPLSHLFAVTLNSLRTNVEIPVGSVDQYLGELVQMALKSENPFQRDSLAQSIACITNKTVADSEITTLVQNHIIPLLSPLFSSSSNPSSRKNSLTVYLWVTKALAIRSHPFGFEMIKNIIGLFKDGVMAKDAANGFAVIVGDEEEWLSKKGFAIVKLLYKQRLFSYCLPLLTEGFNTSDEESRNAYLIALSHLLKNIPKQVLLSALPPVGIQHLPHTSFSHIKAIMD